MGATQILSRASPPSKYARKTRAPDRNGAEICHRGVEIESGIIRHVIEIAALVIEVASVAIVVRVNRILQLSEEGERREEQKGKMRSLEPLKP
jgi:hypothetical protein